MAAADQQWLLVMGCPVFDCWSCMPSLLVRSLGIAELDIRDIMHDTLR